MSQLNLFKGKRQRGERPPAPLEFAGHAFIADLLKRWCSPAWRYTHMPMGESREHVFNKQGKRWSPTASKLKRMGVTPGWPDFLFVGPGRAIFWLELKRKGKHSFSDEQIDIGAHLVACGHAYLATSSVDDAVAELKALGILRANIGV